MNPSPWNDKEDKRRVKVNARLYLPSLLCTYKGVTYLECLAEEFFGKLLELAGHDVGEERVFEFGFEGDDTTRGDMTKEEHGVLCAATFMTILNSPTWRRGG